MNIANKYPGASTKPNPVLGEEAIGASKGIKRLHPDECVCTKNKVHLGERPVKVIKTEKNIPPKASIKQAVSAIEKEITNLDLSDIAIHLMTILPVKNPYDMEALSNASMERVVRENHIINAVKNNQFYWINIIYTSIAFIKYNFE